MTHEKPSLWIYPCLFSAASVGAVLFSPLLPAIQNQFHLGSDAVQLLLTLYLIGFALSQILYTLPAKRYGKKQMILTALSFGLIGNIIVTIGAYSQIFSVLLIGRILCALGAGGTLGLGMGLILDFYTPKESVQVISLGVTSFGVFPSIGAFFAGYLVPFSWILPLHLLSLYYVFLLFFVRSIPDIQERQQKVSLSEFGSGLLRHLTQRKFLAYTCMWGFNTSALYLYATYASLMAINLWGMEIRTFAVLFSIAPLSMAGGLLINKTFSPRLGHAKMLKIGLVLEIFFICSVFYALQLQGTERILLFFTGMAGVYLCTPVLSANATAFGLGHSPDRSIGSSLMGCLNLAITTGTLFVVRALPKDGELVFDKVFLVLALILCLLFVWHVSEKSEI